MLQYTDKYETQGFAFIKHLCSDLHLSPDAPVLSSLVFSTLGFYCIYFLFLFISIWQTLHGALSVMISLWRVCYQYLTQPACSIKLVKHDWWLHPISTQRDWKDWCSDVILCKHLNYFRTKIMSNKTKKGNNLPTRKYVSFNTSNNKESARSCLSSFKSCLVSST